ncbi:type IV pilus assembly protein PilF [Chitinivorax tropicus]|uniref:Type IV pilus assembly protein PilF n=1 Tax=Chitinivorax tropicus TaxID=714531 RepID=A0A840MXA0_9PROT|nr:type IV pilus biogenesis/stability protein PilW [Chitinivorax tropicus]MBB5019781.1 type IV pilus assembly protein PilF [Chitinivorax tropicus]
MRKALCGALAVMAASVMSPLVHAQNPAMSAKLHTELSAQYFSLREYSVAIDEARQALSAVPEYGPAFNMLGLIFSELKEYQAADEYFRKAVQYAPNDSNVNHNYGLFLCRHRAGEDFSRYFQAALRNPLYQSPDKTWAASAGCKLQKGDLEGARDEFAQALAIRPDFQVALVGLASAYFRLQQYQEARTYFGRYFQGADGTAENLWEAIQTERKLNDPQGEARYTAKLKKLYPQSKEAELAANGR